MNVVVHLATDNQMVIPVESGRSMQPRPPLLIALGKNMMHSLHLTDERLSASANVQLFTKLMEPAQILWSRKKWRKVCCK